MARVIVAGSRSFDNFELLQRKLDFFLGKLENVEVVSGGARGADQMGELWAEDHSVPVKLFPADWKKHGKSAGYRRNEEMARYATHLVAFWDGKSRGTKHMVEVARHLGLKTRVVRI